MKLSDYVLQFAERYVDTVFLLSGGGHMHMVDSAGRSGLKTVCCHHEQTVATAAEAYARIRNQIGLGLVTSGPGATNAITGVAGAWQDSIPMLIVAGQVKRDNLMPRTQDRPVLRELGFQELNTIDLVRPITKYAAMVEEPEEIRYHLEKAIYYATTGRPGPVWIELPLDVQCAEIDPDALKPFKTPLTETSAFAAPNTAMRQVVAALRQAERPLLMAGNGVRLAGGEALLWEFLEKTGVNVVTPIFTADDLVTYEYPHYLGRQGMWGNDSANYAVDNCDLLLVIGERLQLTQTSYDYQNFATQAFKIMVDIDPAELHKKTLQIDLPIHCDAKAFLEELCQQEISLRRWTVAPSKIDPANFQGDPNYVNVYRFMEELSQHTHGWHVATSDGTASLLPHRALKIVRGQRFITEAGLGQMGSGLPLAIGACLGAGCQPVICMEGDGSIMLNIQELQTAVHHRLPLKIFLYNNNGYFSIRNTHQNNFGRLFASEAGSGVSLPDYSKLAPAWGVNYTRIQNDSELGKVAEFMSTPDLGVCEIMLDPLCKLVNVWAAGNFRDRALKS